MHMHTHMHTPPTSTTRMTDQNDMWDPDADPYALNERGYGIGQWRLQEHFQQQRTYTRPAVGFGRLSIKHGDERAYMRLIKSPHSHFSSGTIFDFFLSTLIQRLTSDEQFLAKANSVQWMRSNQSDSQSKSKKPFKLVVGVPSVSE